MKLIIIQYLIKWEKKETINLEGDIILRLDNAGKDRKYKEIYENLDNTELDKQVDEELSTIEDIDVASLEDEAKAYHTNKIKLKILTRQFYINEAEKKRLKQLLDMKHQREQELLEKQRSEHPPESTGKRQLSKTSKEDDRRSVLSPAS